MALEAGLSGVRESKSSSKKSSKIDSAALYELQAKVEDMRQEDRQKNKEYQVATNERL